MVHTLVRRVLPVLVILSTSLNGAQALRIYLLHSQATSLWKQNRPQIGDRLPELVVLDVAQRAITVVPAKPRRPILVYWMHPACTWCLRNEANFRTVAVSASDRYDVIAVSSTADGLDAFIENTKPPYQITGPPDAAAIEAYKFGGTPMTIVISPDRRIQHVWGGAYQGVNAEQIERVFNITLPGLLK